MCLMLYKSEFCQPLHSQELHSLKLAVEKVILFVIYKLIIKDNFKFTVKYISWGWLSELAIFSL